MTNILLTLSVSLAAGRCDGYGPDLCGYRSKQFESDRSADHPHADSDFDFPEYGSSDRQLDEWLRKRKSKTTYPGVS